jgi:hypothetical protein
MQKAPLTKNSWETIYSTLVVVLQNVLILMVLPGGNGSGRRAEIARGQRSSLFDYFSKTLGEDHRTPFAD